MQRFIGLFNGHSPVSPTSPTPWKPVHANGKTVTRTEDRAGAGKRNRTVPLVTGSNLKRASSVKDLIQKFSGSESEQTSPARSAASSPTEPPAARRGSGTRVEESVLSSALTEVPKITVDTSAVSLSSGDGEETTGQGPLPSTRLTRPVEAAQSQKEQASVLPQAPTDCTFKSISENKGGLLNGSVTVNGAGSVSPFVMDRSKTPHHHLPVFCQCATVYFALHGNPPAWSVCSLSLSPIRCTLTAITASINPPPK